MASYITLKILNELQGDPAWSSFLVLTAPSERALASDNSMPWFQAHSR